ncbi:FecR family protein [Chitinophaga qingshengii]|uniref:FecR family protein n=1 Tax=Chitinophaga qingshengii TaxID=1569794 RepID=A0ABR7THM5_9BACT|nr:FecR family protein [Chitinophaga qingshengii]MBC9930007.1 FecR family protein [Chitinophaga qingshengii]
MHETSELFRQLTDKYLADTITAPEKELLFSMISEGACLPELEQIVAEIWEQPLTAGEDIVLREQIFNNITARRTKVKQLNIRRWLAVAAAVLLLGAVGTMLLLKKDRPAPLAVVQPGGAVLILGDQSQVPLDSNGNKVMSQDGAHVVQQGAQLTYTAASPASGTLTYNTLRTAVGGQFKLILPDGTHLWINAGSTVRYPAVFSGNERQIEVTGEVYMEVQPDKRPFSVSTPHETVQVLGTAFNISAYNEEPYTLTTLVSGKISVVNSNNTTVTLRPGQQATVSHQPATNIPVKEADIEQVIAWKNGYFNFENERLSAIFRLLSRWYNVQFEAEGKVADLQFSAVIARSASLDKVLSELAATGAVNFSREGNIIRAREVKH